jgi:ABC-type dipeptide/oligopeptide/nickel transport system ATPase component
MIEVRDLRKTFVTPAGDVAALAGVDLEIQKGDIFRIRQIHPAPVRQSP